jgi:hypothetical protein
MSLLLFDEQYLGREAQFLKAIGPRPDRNSCILDMVGTDIKLGVASYTVRYH